MNIKIAISGESGCGNTSLSTLLGERLNLKVVNYTLRNLASEKGMTLEEIQELAKKDNSIDIELDKKIVEMASSSPSVVGSRLAIWIIKDADLKIYLDAPLEVRASRIAKREGISEKEAYEKTEKRDRENRERYKNIYSIDYDKRDFVDMTIDSSKYNPQEILNIILKKLEIKEN